MATFMLKWWCDKIETRKYDSHNGKYLLSGLSEKKINCQSWIQQFKQYKMYHLKQTSWSQEVEEVSRNKGVLSNKELLSIKSKVCPGNIQ